jgi:hypothetical protein
MYVDGVLNRSGHPPDPLFRDEAGPASIPDDERLAMRLAYFCFIAAAVSALGGMCLGIWMGMNEDFTLAPVHAHINLLGWVTLSLYGLYHRGVERRANRLAWAQVGCAALGMPLMTGGLAAYLATGAASGRFIIAGSLLVLLGMALFVAVLVTDLAASRKGSRATAALPA